MAPARRAARRNAAKFRRVAA
eukprot:SAG31_NODE_5958_length_2241_cov_3.839869_3_plen_20_part_01